VQDDEHAPIEELVVEPDPYPVMVCGEPLTDTCKEVIDGMVRATVPRQSLVIVHGPWVFTRAALADALARIAGREAEMIDIMGFCQAAQVRVRVRPRR
jgi:2-C-methyl-D-erythritol 4-phosphate cytidylyltransferase